MVDRNLSDYIINNINNKTKEQKMIAGLILGLPFMVWGVLGVIYEDEIEQGHWFYKLRVNKLAGLGFIGIGAFIILHGVYA